MTKIPKNMVLSDTQLFNIDLSYGKSLILMVNIRAADKEAAQLEVMKRLKFTVKPTKWRDL